jgi:hypothetical protein
VIRQAGGEKGVLLQGNGISTSNKTRQVAETLEERNVKRCNNVVKKTLRISKADKTAERLRFD